MGSFTVQLQQFADKTKAKADDFVGAVVIHIAEKLDKRSPVGDASYWKSKPPKGYVGGFFRGSWMLGVGSVPSGRGTIDPGGTATVGRIIAEVPAEAAGNIFYLGNTAPYGQRIEDGWSPQAPTGLVALTAMEFQSIVDQAAGAVH